MLAERDHRAGPREAKGLGQLTACDAFEDRVRDGGVVGGPVGESGPDELDGYDSMRILSASAALATKTHDATATTGIQRPYRPSAAKPPSVVKSVPTLSA